MKRIFAYAVTVNIDDDGEALIQCVRETIVDVLNEHISSPVAVVTLVEKVIPDAE